jgi:predicted regulator of Ras-like GTPase activity (Roadblock/LC7/MglB family)
MVIISGIELLLSIHEEFLTLEWVSAASAGELDGTLTEGVTWGKIELESLGAMSSTGKGSLEAMGTELSRGKLLQMHMEPDNGFIIIAPLNDTVLVTIITNTPECSGRIRHALKKNRERLIAEL